MIHLNVQEEVSNYLTKLLDVQLTHFLGKRYEGRGKHPNYQNGGYDRHFTLIRICEFHVRVPGTGSRSLGRRCYPRVGSVERQEIGLVLEGAF